MMIHHKKEAAALVVGLSLAAAPAFAQTNPYGADESPDTSGSVREQQGARGGRSQATPGYGAGIPGERGEMGEPQGTYGGEYGAAGGCPCMGAPGYGMQGGAPEYGVQGGYRWGFAPSVPGLGAGSVGQQGFGGGQQAPGYGGAQRQQGAPCYGGAQQQQSAPGDRGWGGAQGGAPGNQ